MRLQKLLPSSWMLLFLVRTEKVTGNNFSIFFFPSLLANTKPSPGRGQPRISALMQMLPLLNQERGLTLMYLATTGAGKMFRTGISFSLLPLKIY